MPLPHGDAITGLVGFGADLYAATAGGRILRRNGNDWDIQSETYGRLRRMRASGPSDVWVGSERWPLHYDGTSWTSLVAPQAAPDLLTDFWPSSPTDVWGIAWVMSSVAVYRFDGANWNPTSSPHQDWVQDVFGASPTEVWVAYDLDLTQWNGQSFSDISLRDTQSFVSRVWAVPGDLWLLRCIRTAMTAQGSTSVDRYLNGVWQTPHDMLPPPYVIWAQRLKCGEIWGASPTDIWVATRNQLDHWDGTGWQTSANPIDAYPETIWGSGTDDVWIGGEGASLAHWDGTTWTPSNVPSNRLANTSFNGVWCGPDDTVAVGNGVVYARKPDRWSSEWTGTSTLYGVWGDEVSGTVYAVGSQGTLLKRSSGTWTALPSISTLTLRAIWGSSATDIWVGGEQGFLAHFDGATWTPVASSVSDPILSFWASSSTDIWASTTTGILHGDGKTWTVSLSGVQYAQASGSLWGAAANDVWATFGTYGGGSVYHWDGTAWTVNFAHAFISGLNVVTSPSTVAGTGAADVYIAGNDPVGFGTAVYRWDGTGWSVQAAGANLKPLGMCLRKGRGMWIVGGVPDHPEYYGEPAGILYRPLP